MGRNAYLKIILLFSVFGMLFSGYLSYGELFGTCELQWTEEIIRSTV